MKTLMIFVSALLLGTAGQSVSAGENIPLLIRQALANCQACPGNRCRAQHPVIRRIPNCTICGAGRECIGHQMAILQNCPVCPNKCETHPVVYQQKCGVCDGPCRGHIDRRIAGGLFDGTLNTGEHRGVNDEFDCYDAGLIWWHHVPGMPLNLTAAQALRWRAPETRIAARQQAQPRAKPASVDELPAELFCARKEGANTWDLYWNAAAGQLQILGPTGVWSEVSQGASAGKSEGGVVTLLVRFTGGYPYPWRKEK